MDSAAILLAFAAKWSHPDYPPIRVVQSELEIAERTLGVHFPEDYRVGILSAGLPYPTLALLNAVIDRDVELHALAALAEPTEIVEETLGTRHAGMPKNLIVIGNDFSGSKFCFDLADLQVTLPPGFNPV